MPFGELSFDVLDTHLSIFVGYLVREGLVEAGKVLVRTVDVLLGTFAKKLFF